MPIRIPSSITTIVAMLDPWMESASLRVMTVAVKKLVGSNTSSLVIEMAVQIRLPLVELARKDNSRLFSGTKLLEALPDPNPAK